MSSISNLDRRPLHLDFTEAADADARAVALLTDAIRRSARLGTTTLVAPPQLLAHNLYRLGELRPGGRIVLVDPREDEPYSS